MDDKREQNIPAQTSTSSNTDSNAPKVSVSNTSLNSGTTLNNSVNNNNNNNKNNSANNTTQNTASNDSTNLLNNDRIKAILNSDSALDVLSERLKQSLSSAEEFSKFIKKKAQIEDDHYTQLKKFAGHIRTSMKNNSKNLKNDSLQHQMDKIIGFDESLSGVGSSYVTALNTMYDELTSLIHTITRSRKTIKDEYRRKDKECMDAISAADKAKTRYNHLCEDLERLKSSDPSKKSFSLKNKTVEQQEDDLQRKVDLADQEYKSKVATCKKLKDEILVLHRPNNAKKLKNLILEMDIALNVQLQKYATYNETLIMNSGVLISPLQATKSSMKAMASSIDNERDLYKYLLANGSNTSNKSLVPIDYHVHPSLVKTKDIGKPFLTNNDRNVSNSASNIKAAVSGNQWNNDKSNTNANINDKSNISHANSNNHSGYSVGTNNKSSTESATNSAPYAGVYAAPKPISGSTPLNSSTSDSQAGNPPSGYSSLDPGSQPSTPNLNGPKPFNSTPSFKQPTFGVSIEDVIQFAGVDNVPLVVRRCIDVIESYGIDLVGIYRTSSNVNQVQKLRESIDSNFTNYLLIGKDIDESNIIDSDVFCVASLLKYYFANLPEPLVTSAASQSFIDTVKLNDEHLIHKKLHHLVFSLPDGAYFTLRALIFHLNKIAANEARNRMNTKSLSIIWGPVIFNNNSTSAQDLSFKSKVVEELMTIATDIFEVDEE
ncbi:RGD1 [Candida theae]|uniref:RGD1 n=1 Tax=Candida theae TaxID=1198502 RepID=A0AAD5FYU1_9ASCO|nr:RGD1 [Candida theae]KAI5958277.1 RGD1 [Candida theae]